MADLGRPTKFTPERCKAIIADIIRTIPYELAAEANGICEDTLYEWLKIGKQHLKEGNDSDYARFSESIKKAERDKMVVNLNQVEGGADKWQANAWILERRWWKHFSSSAPVIDFNKRLSKMENGVSDDGEANSSKTKSITQE